MLDALFLRYGKDLSYSGMQVSHAGKSILSNVLRNGWENAWRNPASTQARVMNGERLDGGYPRKLLKKELSSFPYALSRFSSTPATKRVPSLLGGKVCRAFSWRPCPQIGRGDLFTCSVSQSSGNQAVYSTASSEVSFLSRKLPLGMQSLRAIIEGGYIYVDKTELALQLIESNKYCFISRPRRFGKSLLVSTLKSIFLGERELFKKCFIYKIQYEWKKHPVVHIDFSQIHSSNPKTLENSLRNKFAKIALAYGKRDIMNSLPASSAQEEFVNLIETLSVENKVALLIDEYDKPVLDSWNNTQTAEEIRDYMRRFFGIVKSLDGRLRFVFVTGVTSCRQGPLFSGLNNLTDLSLDPTYATLIGYTEEEMGKYFGPHMQAIANMRSTAALPVSQGDILKEIRQWYHGYRFSEDPATVYNPHSILNFMESGEAESYWCRTGDPSFLVEQVKKKPDALLSRSGGWIQERHLSRLADGERMRLIPLMFQTGYLTIKDYNLEHRLYCLDFPNQEVRRAFFEVLLQNFVRLPSATPLSLISQEVHKALANRDFDLFFHKIHSCFAKIPDFVWAEAKEGFYPAVFMTLLEGFGIKTKAEESGNLEHVAISFEIANGVYILECTFHKSALDQREDKKYRGRYFPGEKPLFTINVDFNPASCPMLEWKGKHFSPSGELLEEIFPKNQRSCLVVKES